MTTTIIEGELHDVPIKIATGTAIYLTYAFLVPVLGVFGVLTNLINAIIFMRPRMTPSAFTYLAAMSWMDCVSCVLITLTGFAQSVFQDKKCWILFDYKILIPLIGITTGAANLFLVSVTLDRLIYLKNCMPQGPPPFCTRSMARKIVFGSTLVSTLINIPFFFIFYIEENSDVKETTLFSSMYYMVHNWITFILLAIFPGVFLLIANAFMISIIRKWSNGGRCRTRDGQGRDQKRSSYQAKLTITLVVVISLFLVGELPAHLTSRKSAISLLFAGDSERANCNLMQGIRAFCTVLNLIQLSLNIVVYAVINPAFMLEFSTCFHHTFDWLHKMSGVKHIQKFCYIIKNTFISGLYSIIFIKKGITNENSRSKTKSTTFCYGDPGALNLNHPKDDSLPAIKINVEKSKPHKHISSWTTMKSGSEVQHQRRKHRYSFPPPQLKIQENSVFI